MRARPFFWIDAFSDHSLGGNPCAVVLDADDVEPGRMQSLAVEMGLSETAFAMRSDRADVRARYFTPHGEIPLAGHPTIATVFALADAGRVTLRDGAARLSLQLEAGIIPVELVGDDQRLEAVIMSVRGPEFGEPLDAEQVLPAFGLGVDDLRSGAPIQVVDSGTPQLMVALRGHASLRRASTDPARYRALRERYGFFSAHLFVIAGVTSGGDTFARHFGGPEGGVEDPFTGSATASMGAYLWHHALIESPCFEAEQGHWRGRPGRAGVEVVGARQRISSVRVAGGAAVLVRGEIVI